MRFPSVNIQLNHSPFWMVNINLKLNKPVCFTMLRHVSPCFTMFHHVSPCFTMFHHVSPYLRYIPINITILPVSITKAPFPDTPKHESIFQLSSLVHSLHPNFLRSTSMFHHSSSTNPFKQKPFKSLQKSLLNSPFLNISQ